MKRLLLSVLLSCVVCNIIAQEKVKNVILMIPDGCSLATISTARWYQWYLNPDSQKLCIDPYICGTVRTTCSNAPIGDSAPTTSTYMTGYNGLKGWVSTYPVADPENDIYPMNEMQAYQPLTTVLEASRMLLGKSTGLVFSCYFPHATPADCSAHSSDRGDYAGIASQQVHNSLDVVIGGGVKYLSDENEAFLKEHGYNVFRNDLRGMRACKNNRMWALFGNGDTQYEMGRDVNEQPSLAEMTETAIRKLSANKKGFFLMVEGSKVDYAAHANDPIGMITEYLAFDKACKVAFDFAEKDGNTVVVMLSDHGNSGISIGKRSMPNYAGTSKHRLFGALTKCRTTCELMSRKINAEPFEKVQDLFREWMGFELTNTELEALKNNREYKSSPIPVGERKQNPGSLYSNGLTTMIGQFLTDRTGLAFTTGGHTGEDVLVASYHPNKNSRPYGMLTNIELNDYLCKVSGFTHDDLNRLTQQNYVAHEDLLKGLDYEVKENSLVIRDKGRVIVVNPNSNVITVDGKTKELNSVVVYQKQNKMFYLPKDILK